MLVFAVAVGKLVDLQVVHPGRYNQWGIQQRLVSVTLPAGRGSLLDRNGQQMALSIPEHTVYVDPNEVTDPAGTARTLAPVLLKDPGVLERALRQPGRFVYLARQVDDATARRVTDLRQKGIHTIDEAKRFTPAGSLARSLVGQTDIDGKGISGLEAQYDRALTGRPGKLTVERSGDEGKGQRDTIATGRQQLSAARPGEDLVLTIDRSMQYESERVLGEQVKATGAKGGVAIVSRPSTGEVLAMANVSVDPATGNPVPSSDNKAATTTFEPGSVNKVITVSAAVESGEVAPDTSLYVPDHLQLYDTNFGEAEARPAGPMTVSDILAQSSNIGTILLAQKLGKARIDDNLRRFGLGQLSALHFPNEAAGLLRPPDKWSGTDIGSIPIGQGLSVTPIQMLSAFNVIANDGRYVAPKLVAATVDQHGVQHATKTSDSHQVVSAKTAAAVQQMMVEVVRHGTGTKAAVPGYTVAGKTGTARKPLDNGKYQDASGAYHYVSTFAGFVPGKGSDLSIIVVLDEPQGSVFAADVAAPVFQKLASYALRQFHIPPAGSLDPSTDATAVVVDNRAPPPPPPPPAGSPTGDQPRTLAGPRPTSPSPATPSSNRPST